MGRRMINLNVNGEIYQVEVEPWQTLLDVLRNQLEFTSIKQGCDGTGECGACSVIVDGRVVYSCLFLALDADGKPVTTVEGLSMQGALHPLQRSFVDHGGVQCGFCTPGLILTAKALLDEVPSPSEREVKEAIQGNLCRCTGYAKVMKAIMAVAEEAER